MPQLPLLPFSETTGLPLCDVAHRYADAGAAVFPCWPGTKRPALTHSFHEATHDHQQINRWWSRQPDANIAIRTGDLVDVLDIDVHDTGTGFPHLQRALDAGFGTEWAHAVRSPHGGLHLYYPSDPDRPQRNWSRESAHIDFRGTGGYIMAPPSRILVDGQPRPYAPIGAAYAGSPVDGDAIRDLLSPPRPVAPIVVEPDASLLERGERLGDWLAGFLGSNRNEALFWSACRLVEAGASASEAFAFLVEPASGLGLEEREVFATISRAADRAMPAMDSARSGRPWTTMTGRGLR